MRFSADIPAPAIISMIPEVHRVEILDAQGQVMRVSDGAGTVALRGSYVPPAKYDAMPMEDAVEWLTYAYLEAGPGTHSVASITPPPVEGNKLRGSWEVKSAGEYFQFLPRALFSYRPPTEAKPAKVRFAEGIAIAMRKATSEELTAYKASRNTQFDPNKRKHRIAVRNESMTPMDFTHAHITSHDVVSGDGRYLLTLDSPNAVFAARIIHQLSVGRRGTHSFKAMLKAAWSETPDRERSLILPHSPTNFVDAALPIARHLVTGLLSQMKIADWHTPDELVVHPSSLSVEFIDDANGKVSAELEEAVVLYDPQTIFDKDHPRVVEQLEEAQLLYDRIYRDGSLLTHEEAIRVMDFVTDPHGKTALALLLRGTRGAPSFVSADFYFRQVARNGLGEDKYQAALRQRTHHGGETAGRVEQIGGALRGSRTKWYLGMPTKPTEITGLSNK